MPETKKTTFTMKDLDATLTEYFVKKAPAIPSNIKEIIVKFGPYLIILGVILAIPAILGLLGLRAFVSGMPMMYGYGYGAFTTNYMLSIAILAVTVVLEIMALPGLFARKISGWNFLFYSVLVSALSSLISFNLVGLILGLLIGLWVLYQVKEYYK